MAVFDESKVINALHPEKAEIGKKYLFADDIVELKVIVESGAVLWRKLEAIQDDGFYYLDSLEMAFRNFLIYPYEEPPKQRMTKVQFMEWLSKGNGLFSRKDSSEAFYGICCRIDKLNDEVEVDIIIRTWDSDEWVEPTVDIYERDCKEGK